MPYDGVSEIRLSNLIGLLIILEGIMKLWEHADLTLRVVSLPQKLRIPLE
jgi:hypothetical protein